MKPVFKCDYCSRMGTVEEIREHEPKCFDNYDRQSCFTCVHRKTTCSHNIKEDKVMWIYECKIGKEIPKGNIFEFCKSYERKEKPDEIGDLFNGIFGL